MVPYIIVYRLKIQDDHSSRTKFDIEPFGENILNQSTIWNQIWLEYFTTKYLLFVLNENPKRPPPQDSFTACTEPPLVSLFCQPIWFYQFLFQYFVNLLDHPSIVPLY